jgi:hypothetical protein
MLRIKDPSKVRKILLSGLRMVGDRTVTKSTGLGATSPLNDVSFLSTPY